MHNLHLSEEKPGAISNTLLIESKVRLLVAGAPIECICNLSGRLMVSDKANSKDRHTFIPTKISRTQTHTHTFIQVNAVVASDGISYDRAALLEYFTLAKTANRPLRSPTTGDSLREMRVTNHLISTQAREWFEEHGKKG